MIQTTLDPAAIADLYLRSLAKTEHFIQGDEAAAMGSLFAGCTFFGGYPITPASEIAEVMSRMLPLVNGHYVQFEDELASIAAVIGSAWAGARSMTATSGPGFSLMQENIGYAAMTETPCVIIDVQRSGPSTGQATLPAQGDVMQARWGTHGDHEIIALSPATVQECFDLAIRCFNLAEEFRTGRSATSGTGQCSRISTRSSGSPGARRPRGRRYSAARPSRRCSNSAMALSSTSPAPLTKRTGCATCRRWRSTTSWCAAW